MFLEQVSPGRWINHEWRPGTPGAFALIVGVSAYPYLRGGKDTYDLPSLHVSALTAFRVFEWLRDDYLHRGCPLARCWLLLSPTGEELRTASMSGHYAPATFNSIKTAILEWTQAMKDQDADAARGSRGFFFFSGHGVEIQSEHQVLLPSDYLAPPNPPLNDAISTFNLFRGLLRDRVPLHLLFIDACRNDHDALMAEEVEGASILNTGGKRKTSVTVNMLRATASGFQAWQPDTPSEGESVFGRALLEGFRNRALKDCATGDCWIPMYPLQKFVNARVMEILRSYKVLVESPVRLGGQVDDALVTQVPEDVHRPEHGDPGSPSRDERDLQTGAVDAALVKRTTLDKWNPRTETDPRMRVETATHAITYAHDVFGSERMEELWHGARVYALKERRWLPDGQGFVLHAFEWDETSKLFRATLSVPDVQGDCVLELRQTWMPPERQAGEIRVPRSFSCMLPAEPGRLVQYSVLMTLEYDSIEGRVLVPYRFLSRVEVNLAPANGGLLGDAARAWQLYQRAGIGAAAGSPEYERLRANRYDSSLAGLVLGILAIRGRRLQDLEGLPERLVAESPDMPDAAILRSAQLLYDEAAPRAWNDHPIRALEEMSRRGAPWTGEGVSIALGVLADALDEEPLQDRMLAENLTRGLRRVARSMRSGGGFCAVYPDLEDLGLLEPTPGAQQARLPSAGSATATA